MSKISKRILAISNLVPQGCDVVWDICCDHGLIGREVLSSRLKSKVIFIDQVHSIIVKLKLTLKTSYIPDRYKIINSKAEQFDFQNKHQSNCYIVAGIGGELSLLILEQIEKSLKENDNFIFSVHKNHLKLRELLIQKGFKLASERLIAENNIFYEVLLVSKSAPNEITRIGSFIWDEFGDDEEIYLKQQIKYYQKKCRYNPGSSDILQAYQELAKNKQVFTS
ncbi:MAG: hypothetical protein HON90_16865 [Halobacteriovoraceae bacterium]|nr:hypothetical protein [Halobacteriovoraceae bacterium]